MPKTANQSQRNASNLILERLEAAVALGVIVVHVRTILGYVLRCSEKLASLIPQQAG
jgi:hypothetical protein